MTIELSNSDIDVLSSIADLMEDRANEPCIRKTIAINAFSISRHSSRSYKCVKRSLKRINKKLKDLK